MEELTEIPRQRSAARTWMQTLAWAIPGITAPALLLGAVLLAYGTPGQEPVAIIGFWVILLGLVVGCAFFDNLLHIPRRRNEPLTAEPVRKFKWKRFAFFIVMQAVLTPLIGFATGSACTAIFNL